MINFFALYDILGFFTTLWFVCWAVIFIGSFRIWGENNWIFGFLILYIIFFPIYRRWDRYFNDILIQWPSFWVSIIIIILLIIFWIIVFISVLPNMLNFCIKNKILRDKVLENKIIKTLLIPAINKKSKIRSWLENFSKIWSSWLDLFSYLPYSRFIFDFISNKFKIYLNTKERKMWFFGLTLILPRILCLIALFYDIYIENQLYWFPKIVLLLTISVLIKMCLTMIEKGSEKNFNFVCSLVVFEPFEKEILLEEDKKQLKKYENLGFDFITARVKVKDEFKDQIYGENFELLINELNLHHSLLQWCKETNELLNPFLNGMMLLFVTCNLYAQIKIILEITKYD